MKTLVLLLITCVITEVVQGKRKENDIREPNAAAKVYSHLMASYDRWNPDSMIIPQFNLSKPIKVKCNALSLQALVDFDESTDIATFETYENFEWTDEFLRWNPEDFVGVSSIRVRSDRIWSPDIELYNAIHHCAPATNTLMVVYADGRVSWVPTQQRMVRCSSNDTNISCRLTFGSWSRDGSKLDLELTGSRADISTYAPHKRYELLAVPVIKNTRYYDCCSEPYVDITYAFEFKKEKSAWWYGKK